MSTGQIVGGVVGAVVGYFVSGMNPMGAVQSAEVPAGIGSFIDQDGDTSSKAEGDDE